MQYITEAVRLYDRGLYDFIELFVVPDTFDQYSGMWADVGIPYIMHAPHYDKGLNLAKRDNFKQNVILARETFKYADKLKSSTIIFHPGVEGDIRETAHQLNELKDARIVIENKPYYGHCNVICNGSSPEEIEFVLSAANVGFCLDIGHAICAANAKKIEPMSYVKNFMALKPSMYHFSDGEYENISDRHDHLGGGTYPLKDIIALLPADSVITVETDKDFQLSLNDFEEDINYLKSIV